MIDPFFSIIVPTYNRAHIISRAVESVLNQTYSNWELIVIDDGSMDNTKSVIKEFNDNRLKYYYQTNQERSTARNNGISKASGQYICFLDSDDEYYNDYLELLYKELNKNQFPVGLFKSIPLIRLQNEDRRFDKDFEEENNSIEHFLTTYSPLCAISGHAEIFMNFKFDTDLKYAEDTNLWMRILTKYSLYNFKIRSCIIHISQDSSKRQEHIHWEYIHSFKKTFAIEEVKKIVPKKIVSNLITRRLEWIKAEGVMHKDFFVYLKAAIKLKLLKLGVF